MKKTFNYALLALVAAVLLHSCRLESDEVSSSYGLSANEVLSETYTEKWDVLWKGFNQNYVAWEIEAVDWDEVNAKYRPLLEKLDERVKSLSDNDTDSAKIISEEAAEIFHAAYDTLHDGHTFIKYKDYAVPTTAYGTKNYIYVQPQFQRVSKRPDYNDYPRWGKSYYVESNQVEQDSVKWIGMADIVCRDLMALVPQLQDDLTAIDSLETTSNESSIYKTQLKNLISVIKYIQREYEEYPYNAIFYVQSYLQMYDSGAFYRVKQKYGLPYIFGIDSSNEPMIQTFVTNDNIVYIRLNTFILPWNLSYFALPAQYDTLIEQKFKSFHAQWYNTVQQMHKEQRLRGVIVDLRSNMGGETENAQYIAGSLLGNEDVACGTRKKKNGLGRLDYGMPTLCYVSHYNDNAEKITEPIVVLANAMTASCGEINVAALKQQDNCTLVGKATYGAANSLCDNANFDSMVGYAGQIGSENGNFYAYIPFCLDSFYGLGVIEGAGIMPDIDIRYDADLFNSTGCDTQLNAALECIRNGK
jgi:hypothetical protein